MKIAILGDIHFGKKLEIDSVILKFFNTQFFPYIKENKIDFVVQMGDLLNNRRTLNLLSGLNVSTYISMLRKFYIENSKLSYVQLLGNHDLYYIDTADFYGLKAFFENSDFNHIIINEPRKLVWSDKKFKCSFVSWGTKVENFPTNSYLFGHFDINGFEMQKGIEAVQAAYNKSDFLDYELVFSGHFHKQDRKGNILYVGSIIDLDFGECEDEHGFWIFDTDNGNLDFIKNEYTIHHKVVYDNDKLIDRKGNEIDLKLLNEEGKKFKIIVKDDIEKFSKFKENILKEVKSELIVSEVDIEVPSIDIDSSNIDDTSLVSLMKQYVDSMGDIKGIDKDKLFDMILSVHNKAIEEVQMGDI